MATQMFIKFTGPDVAGDAANANHAGEIEILNWSHGFNQPTSPIRSSAGGGTVERANHMDLSFTKYLDLASVVLMKNCWSGAHHDEVLLSCYRASETGEVKYLEISMKDVVISNVSISGGGGDLPVENYSLAYGDVTYTYTDQAEDSGAAGGNTVASHNLKTDAIA
jgi:type VI secretion system secreted protein Hcp